MEDGCKRRKAEGNGGKRERREKRSGQVESG
jgi:hypothetical protein